MRHRAPSLADDLLRSKAVSWASWEVPRRVFIDDEVLRWQWLPDDEIPAGSRGNRIRRVVSSPDLLMGFLELDGAPSSKILRFAKRFGPLYGTDTDIGCLLARPGSPLEHLGMLCEGCGPDNDPPMWEPLEGWRTIAHLGRALLRMFGAERAGTAATDADWEAFGATPGPWGGSHLILNDWLLAGGVTPALSIATNAPVTYRVDLRVAGLFGAVASQLALVVGQVDGFAVCSGCAEIFLPARTPPQGKRRYCQACRDAGVDQRHAARDSYRRKHSLNGAS